MNLNKFVNYMLKRSATIRNHVGMHPQPYSVLNPEKLLLLSATKSTTSCYFLWVKKLNPPPDNSKTFALIRVNSRLKLN